MGLLLLFPLLVVCGTLLLIFLKKVYKSGIPPGPRGLPIVGHLLHFHDKEPYIKAIEWEKTYGPIISIRFGSYPAIILNDTNMIKTLFKNPLVNGRPDFNFFNESRGGAKSLAFCQGDDWTDLRKLTVQSMKAFGVSKTPTEDCIKDEIISVLGKIKNNDGGETNVRSLFETSIAIHNMQALTGERFSQDDQYFRQTLKRIIDQTPSKHSLAILPFVMPWVSKISKGFNKLIGYDQLLESMKEIRKFFRKYIDLHKETYQPNVPRDLIDIFLDKINEAKDPNSVFHLSNSPLDTLEFSLIDLFTGAGETTLSTLTWIMIALAYYKDVQEKIYEEIANKIGSHNLPTMKDRANCPYTECFIMEVIRYRPVTALGLARKAIEEIHFEGYRIPKGTIIFPNVYAASHDEKYWEKPEEFNPLRFANSKSELKSLDKPDNILGFGKGKRNCPGEISARETLFLFVASTVQKFKVLPAQSDKINFEIVSTLFLSIPKCEKVVFEERK